MISMKDIYQQGQIYSKNESETIYLTPDEPDVFDANKWVYHQMPSLTKWKHDLEYQLTLHLSQHSNHLAFTFPENESLNHDWIDTIKGHGFEIGLMELYAIKANHLKLKHNSNVHIEYVTSNNLDDYIDVFRQFSLPFGETFTENNVTRIYTDFDKDAKSRIVAYKDGTPVGILDMISSHQFMEIDGFGVLEPYQRQGIGSAMQSFVAQVDRNKTIILIADGQDSARNMYIKQGYRFVSRCYQIVNEEMV